MAGTSTGGDVKRVGAGSFSIDATSGAQIYSGSIAGTTGLEASISTGDRRYNSTEKTQNFTKALGATGVSIVYREKLSATVGGEHVYDGSTGRFITVNGEDFALSAKQNGASVNLRNAGRYDVTSDDAKALGIVVTDGVYVIKQREITVSGITARDKTYDGDDRATLVFDNVILNGKLVGDSLTVTTNGTFSDKKASDGAKTVTLSALTLGGTDAANYVLKASGQQTTTQAFINKATVTISGVTAQNRTYNGDTAIMLNTSNITRRGVVEGDDVQVTLTGALDSKDAGLQKDVRLSATTSGSDASNYTFVLPTTLKVDIAKAQITVSGMTASDKVYDGRTDAVLDFSQVRFSNKFGRDSLTVTANGRFDEANAGQGKTVSISGLTLSGEDARNYELAASGQQTRTNANINQASLTVSVNDVERDSDNIPFTGPYEVSYSGFVNGEGPHVLRGALSFSGPALTATEDGAYPISASGLSAANYTITYADGTLQRGRRLMQEAVEVSRLPVIPIRRFAATMPVVPLCQPALISGRAPRAEAPRSDWFSSSFICSGTD